MRQRPGFSLVELIVALVLSTFVLVAIVGVTSQMLRYEFQGNRKATSTNWSLTAQDQIKKDLSSASVLYCPSASTINNTGLGGAGCTQVEAQVLSGCINYSFKSLPVAGPNYTGKPTTAFYYCVWCGGGGLPDNCATGSKTPWLLRYEATAVGQTCPIALPTCGVGTYSVVAQDVYLNAANAWFFRRDDAVSGVEIQFMVGIGTTALSGNLLNSDVPTAQRASFRVSMGKSYGNSLD